MNFEIHHFAYLTQDIELSVKEMNSLGFKQEGPVFDIIAQKVSVCFMKNSNNIRYELVKPFDNNKSLKRLISNGITLYHTGYLVHSISESANYLIDRGFFQVNTFSSEAFNGNKCSFFISPSNNLIELIEL
jgi:hypothetical protein|tara:strand:+ start:665 stop:1057 length:393 start_codon:yes stop_codon:yes gene_type:complete